MEEVTQDVVASRGSLVLSRPARERVAILTNELLPFAKRPDLEPAQIQALVRLLILTVPRYADAPSRRAVLQVLAALLAHEHEQADSTPSATEGTVVKKGITGGMIKWLEMEVEKLEKVGAVAPSTRYVLLTWATAIFASFNGRTIQDAQFNSLVSSLSSLVYRLLDEEVTKKLSVRHSVVALARRVVRNNHTSIPRLISTLTKASSDPLYRHTPFLGIVVDVALHLKEPLGRKEQGKAFAVEAKDSITAFFLTNVVAARTLPPSQVRTALEGFFAATVEGDDLATTFLPAFQKVLSRSPDVALPVIIAFLSSLPASLQPSATVRAQLLPSFLSHAKSLVPTIRSACIQLFEILFTSPDLSTEEISAAALEVYTPLKTSKTSSPDHRTSLFTMLSTLAGSATLSQELSSLTLTLLPKESNDLALGAMMSVLIRHLPVALASGTSLTPAQFTSLIKGMAEPKASTRRAFSLALGEIIWSLGTKAQEFGEGEQAFAVGILPGLETALKTVVLNTLNSPAGPLEGYVAVAVLKLRLGKWGFQKIDDFIAGNPTMQGLLTTGAKPSFLLWDKVYRKLTTAQEETWLLRALEAVLLSEEDKITKDQALRNALAHALIHVGVESDHFESRQRLLDLLKASNARSPRITHLIMRRGLRSWLLQVEKTKPVAKPVSEDQDAPTDRAPRLRLVLRALTAFNETTPAEVKSELLSGLLVLSHHEGMGPAATGLWVDLVLHARIEVGELVADRLSSLLDSIFNDASTSPISVRFSEAAYRAATTLAFISPALAIPRLFTQLEDDLSVSHLSFIGSNEYGIWATPEGTPFVDVLAAQKPKGTISKKSKEHEIEMWEAELREALARKRPTVASLSKSDRILVEKQLAKEAESRKAVAEALGRLRRGFALLLCLVHSKTELVREYLATLVKNVLAVIVLRPATLVAPEAFATYQALGDICSERLGASRSVLGVAVLRSLEAQVVPADLSSEPVASLVTRVLYRLRILAEQQPFDAGTFAYAAPLVSKMIRSGGIGIAKSNQEGALEQLALAVEFISFHARQCADTAFPRLSMIEDLIAALIAYPTLSRTATAGLAELSQTMKTSATLPEVEAFLQGTMTEEVYVRFACLQALQPLDLTELEFPASLWIACHDIDARNRQLALDAWEENGLDVPESFLGVLIPFLAHSSNAIRQATAHAIAGGVEARPETVATAIQLLVAEYTEKVKELLPVYDSYGLIVEASLTVEDPWRTRVAIGTTLKLLSDYFSPADVDAFFDLLIRGEALGDQSQAVRSEMLDAAVVVIDNNGKENLQSLIAVFEEYLGRPSTGDMAQDYITEALVILFGRLARHLDPSDPRIASVIGRLVDALRTPSEVVQLAVCECLPPLVKVIKNDVPPLVDQLLNDLFTAAKYAERRGAAYGLAGVVKGRGLLSLKEFGILGALRDNAEDKKNIHARQGAIFGYEILSTVLGRLFEPYIPPILPILLASFGDTAPDVREATQDAAKAIMGKLSGHAVKLILPTLLSGLDDKQWRAKKGAIELMGAMAFLAPKQLSVSLPTIIPRLTEVLTDTHKQVREAANSSLKRFGEVIANPEIQAMQSVLLEALVDPSRKTPKALDALLATTFAHFIDSSSLALIIPILDRGLRERSADVKRKASAIVGNMATITESKDLVPYLSQLVPLLRGVLIDPVPEARSTAAKSLGGLVERLGESNFPDLIDTLMQVLKSPSSGVDQQGAAQGVSEILAGLAIERLEGLLPSILENASSPRAYVREGHISLLIFLPATFGDRFSPYLGRIIQPVLRGLADDSDYVREASMRAGRMIVANHSTKAIELLLPELELGLFDGSWRIRQSSVQLVGELLFQISGVSGKPDEDEDGEEDGDEGAVTSDNSKKALVDTLGKDRRDRVFAALYIVRQDGTGVVRQAAIHVWKALVQNTPRTVREILPLLMQIIVRTLASPGIEQRETAARCLAETCRKLGEAVLGEVIGILQKAMASSDRRQREGVCLALTEIMEHSNKTSLEAHEGAVIAAIRGALVDPDPIVRSAAAQAFDAAQQAIGPRSIDETIPTLLDALQQPGDTADAALAALKEVMQVRAEKIFPVLIPRLIASPITAFNARALASLVRVAGAALGRRLTNIVDALQVALETEKDEATLADIDEALTAVLSSVVDHDTGLSSLQMHMLALAKSESPAKRVTGCVLFGRFCQATESDFSDYSIDWIRQLVSLFDDRSPEVVGAAWQALDALVKITDKEDMEPLVVPLRRTIESTGTPGVPVDGFSRPNGLKPILPILLQGLLSGTAEQREQAAFAIGDLVERTAPESFKSYCIQTVGPLIRVIGDRFPAPIKSAILSTLSILLTRVPQFTKPFFPQLQRTFVKSLTDPTSLSVRNRAVTALGVLMLHQPRVDPIITELTNLVSTESGSSDIRDSIVNGLAAVISSGGANVSESSKEVVLEVLGEAFADSSVNRENYNVAIGRLVAALALHDSSALEPLVPYLLEMASSSLSSLTIREIVDAAPKAFYELGKEKDVLEKVLENVGQAPNIARPARETKELMKEREPWASDEKVLEKLEK